LSPNSQRSHHFVVLVFDDVAVPHELAGNIQQRFHACDLARLFNSEARTRARQPHDRELHHLIGRGRIG
jgi:hypothetical protein